MLTPEQMVLKVISGPFKNQEFDLSSGAISIGREQNNDVVIPDITVSRKHATILYQRGKFLIQDNNSANGTKVNDIKIKDQVLDLDSKIEIGPCTFNLLKVKPLEMINEDINKNNEIFHDTTPEPSDNWLLDDLEKNKNIDSEEKKKKKESESLFKSPIVRAILGIMFLIMIISLLCPSDKNGSKKSGLIDNYDEQQFVKYHHPEPIYRGSPSPDSLTWAKARFDEAERDYRDREVATKLHSAVKKWERGLNTLARYEKRPNIFDETILKLEKAKEEMHQKYKGKKESCERALKQKDLANAKRYLNDITKSIIPDGRDLRYQWANQKLDSLNSLR